MKWAKRMIALVFLTIGWCVTFGIVAYVSYGEGEAKARQNDAVFMYYHCTHPDEHITFGSKPQRYTCHKVSEL